MTNFVLQWIGSNIMDSVMANPEKFQSMTRLGNTDQDFSFVVDRTHIKER